MKNIMLILLSLVGMTVGLTAYAADDDDDEKGGGEEPIKQEGTTSNYANLDDHAQYLLFGLIRGKYADKEVEMKGEKAREEEGTTEALVPVDETKKDSINLDHSVQLLLSDLFKAKAADKKAEEKTKGKSDEEPVPVKVPEPEPTKSVE